MSADRFDPLAAAYDDHAAVAAEAGKRLLERLDGLRFEPERILELGCATGRHCRALRQRFGRAHIVGLDHSTAMLDLARRRRGRWRPRFDLLRADFETLPLASASVDLVYANLSLNWARNPQRALAALRRVMRPGGLALVSVFGPDTLAENELKKELALRLLPDVQQLGALLVGAGFSEPVLDTDWLTTTHSARARLIAELRGTGLIGSGDAARQGQSPVKDEEADSAEAPADSPGSHALSWEIVSASAWAPDAGQPIRGERGEEASVPVGSIGIRRRS